MGTTYRVNRSRSTASPVEGLTADILVRHPRFFSLCGLLTDGIFHIQIARDGESSLRARVPTVGTQSMENFRGGITSRASGSYGCYCFPFPPNSAAWTCCADPGHDRQGVMVI
jgi:hypothetical protein